MNRKRLWLFIIVLIMVGSIWQIRRIAVPGARTSGSATFENGNNTSIVQNDSISQASPVGQDESGPSATPAPPIKSFFNPQNRELDALRTPIDFYGKVVDENNAPVADATVRMGAVDNSSEQSTKYERKTDERGLFPLLAPEVPRSRSLCLREATTQRHQWSHSDMQIERYMTRRFPPRANRLFSPCAKRGRPNL